MRKHGLRGSLAEQVGIVLRQQDVEKHPPYRDVLRGGDNFYRGFRFYPN